MFLSSGYHPTPGLGEFFPTNCITVGAPRTPGFIQSAKLFPEIPKIPDAPPTVQPRYRGIHVLQRDEHGYEKCVGCFLCAAACPANCIYIEAAENTAANRISAGERYAKVYNIDYSRCIFCGYCVEACPTDAITHGHSIELAPYNINALIYRKEQLLEPWPPRAKQ